MSNYVNNWPSGYNYNVPVLFVKKLKEAQLTDEQVENVLKIMDEICHECWDREGRCSCWNDE